VLTKIDKLFVVVGASHARRLETQLREAGERTILVETPNFRLLNRDVTDLTAKIKEALGNKKEEEAVILLNNIDNCFYLARSEDGHHCPPRKDLEGKYHIDGDLVCAPTDTAKQLFLNMVPLLKEFNSYQKIILTPLPRYLYAPCCTDPDHIPNLENEDHVPKLLANLDSTHRLWRGIAFRDKISNFKICNVSKLLAEQAWWRSDPVHPTVEGYNRVSTFILKGFRALLEKC
jgi:hypothetical protein